MWAVSRKKDTILPIITNYLYGTITRLDGMNGFSLSGFFPRSSFSNDDGYNPVTENDDLIFNHKISNVGPNNATIQYNDTEQLKTKYSTQNQNTTSTYVTIMNITNLAKQYSRIQFEFQLSNPSNNYIYTLCIVKDSSIEQEINLNNNNKYILKDYNL